ncbi:MAG: hypothetical protein IPK85_26985 [Gemmatimonadetes bacterium]|nr:hypothetical protein [Gemmatimonadota bacterium]
MLKRLVPALIALAGLVEPLDAQRRPRERARDQGLVVGNAPRWFATAGPGIHWGPYVVDDATGSTWDLDAAFSLRGSLEREVARFLAVGVAFNYARLPLNFNTFGGTSGCSRCAADATISSYGATVRYGGGPGFHQVIEGFLGALRYGNFAVTGREVDISNTDFAFGAGYGFGYTIAPDWQLQFVQDGLYAVHERSTSGQGGGRFARHFNSRLSLRVGF